MEYIIGAIICYVVTSLAIIALVFLRTREEDRMILVNGNKVSEVICLSCYRRWVAARPTDTRLDDLEYPSCHEQGMTIETGETCFVEDLLRQANS